MPLFITSIGVVSNEGEDRGDRLISTTGSYNEAIESAAKSEGSPVAFDELGLSRWYEAPNGAEKYRYEIEEVPV